MSDGNSGGMERCPVHGSYYRVNQGCGRCQSGEPASAGPAAGSGDSERSLPIVPIFVLLVCGAGGFLWWQGRGESESESAAAALPSFAQGNQSGIDPVPFRVEIEAIERLLYEQSDPDFSDPDRAQNAVMALAEAVRGNVDRLRSARLYPELISFGSQISGIMDAGYQSPTLERFQEQWEEIRGSHFQGAAWYHSPTSDRGGTDNLSADIESLSRWVAAMREEANWARAQLASVRDVDAFPDSSDARVRDAIRRWNRFASEWPARTARVQRLAPPEPARAANNDYFNAHFLMRTAQMRLEELGVNWTGLVVPPRADRQRRQEALRAALAEAEPVVARLQD